ncbi:MAG: N-acetyl sugar amidotransferase [Microbacteriaceae bacterium]|nr:N-acetyl sugar amidotransferase [Microbacteriaceae bacterium]
MALELFCKISEPKPINRRKESLPLPNQNNSQRCTITVMDTTDPDITFDEHGVSSHVHHFEKYYAKTLKAATNNERASELEKLVLEIKKSGKNKPYDCVVGVSGGIDSTYLIYQAVQLGLRPLAVHFDNGWNSEIAAENIKNTMKHLGVDLVTEEIDQAELLDIQLAFLKASVPNCEIPTDHAFPAVAYKQAVKYGIKYILSGTNIATESVLPKAWGYDNGDPKHLKAIHKRFGKVPLKEYPVMGWFRRKIWYGGIHGIATIPLLDYMRYVKNEAKAKISSELEWKDYGGKHHESVFTRYFQGYYLPTKFNFDKRLAHFSSLILSGQMTREEALKELENPTYDKSLQKQDHYYIARKLGITPEELNAIIDLPPQSHLSYPNHSKSRLLWGRHVDNVGAVLGILRRKLWF